MEKLIINAAITGMVPTKAENPNVPITPQEIVDEIRRCRDSGASIVHIHARDADSKPTYRGEIYYEIFAKARAECPDVILSGSTSGRLYKEFWQRAEVLAPGPDCHPDLASLTLGSMNFPNSESMNAPEMIQNLATKMKENGIVPEWEVFDLGMIDYARFLIKRGILVKPYYCNILLGSLGTLSASPLNLVMMVNALPEGTVWSATGIGRFQFYVNAMAITMGGHVRVGLEDNLYYDEGKTELATNQRLIERLVKLARAAGREIASPNEARKIIGLKARQNSGNQ